MRIILLALGFVLLGVTAAAAVDCAAPETPSDRMICGDPGLEALEMTLGNALKVALDNSRAADRDVLTANQQVFIDTRATDCETDDAGDPAPADTLRQCLLDETNARIKYLTGAPLEGPGAPDPMVPQVFQGKDSSFVWSVRFVDPRTDGERLFNRLVYDILKTVHIATSEDDFTDSFSLVVRYTSPRLISAKIDMAYIGPAYAHPMPSTRSINVDLAAGRELVLADAFDAAAVTRLEAFCETRLADYLAPADEGADIRRLNVDTMVGSLQSWTFGATEAVAAWDDYSLDAPLECHVPYATLRPLIKAGFPLPE